MGMLSASGVRARAASWARTSRRVGVIGLRRRDLDGAYCNSLIQFVIQGERMLEAVTNGGVAVSAEALEISGSRARDDGVKLLRLAAFKYSSTLQHKTATPGSDAPGDTLKSDE